MGSKPEEENQKISNISSKGFVSHLHNFQKRNQQTDQNHQIIYQLRFHLRNSPNAIFVPFVVFLAVIHVCLVVPDTAVSSASEHIKILDVSNGLLKFIPPLLSIHIKYNF